MTINKAMADKIIDFLNHLLEVDADWVNDLFQIRRPCNTTIESAFIDLSYLHGRMMREFFLGLLNGLCGTLDDDVTGYIAMEIDDETKRINRFIPLGANDVDGSKGVPSKNG